MSQGERAQRDRVQAQKAASRRRFLKTSGAVVGGALTASLARSAAAHAAGTETLKVGLIGCGGRGTGAASQALAADPAVKLTAMADTFEDHLTSSLANLKKALGDAASEKIDVAEEQKFVGFDAYEKLLATDVDVVLLATPPHFRPAQLKATVEAGKHVFCEKPVAVDAPGVRSVYATSERAKEKGLSLVSGLCWRYHPAVQETIARIQDGAVGEIVAIQENYNAGGLWKFDRKPEWSDMEWQMRNWLYFTWLSGDHNVEQHVHSLDKSLWLLGDERMPQKATGLGGRQARTSDAYGHIFDHHAVCYEFDEGVRVYSYCRQQDGCTNDVEDYVLGTKGQARVLKHEITGPQAWRYGNARGMNMYQLEHDALFASIRSGEPINNGRYMTNSTMMAIMGRMATYSGKTITWEEALNSQEDLSPPAYTWGDLAVPAVAVPGQTPFV